MAACRKVDRGQALPQCGMVVLAGAVVTAWLGAELVVARVLAATCVCGWVVCLYLYGRLQHGLKTWFSTYVLYGASAVWFGLAVLAAIAGAFSCRDSAQGGGNTLTSSRWALFVLACVLSAVLAGWMWFRMRARLAHWWRTCHEQVRAEVPGQFRSRASDGEPGRTVIDRGATGGVISGQSEGAT